MRCFGARTVRADENGSPPLMEVDTIMRMGQATALIGIIMALQCVDRGLLTLDESVERFLPDLTSMKVLAGFDAEGKPIMRERNGIITLRFVLNVSCDDYDRRLTKLSSSHRHMLTDTSGLSHVPINPLLQQYVAKGYSKYPLPVGSETEIPDPLDAPPVGDPGSEWIHGTNLDWAGKLVERATGLDLETYMQQNVCEPLGITDMTFKLLQRPDLIARRADLTKRNREDGKLYYDDSIFFREDPKECYGGSGLFASPAAFMKVMHSLLKKDSILLKSETVDLMFQPALEEGPERRMNEHFNMVMKFINYGYPLPQWPSLRRNFGLGAVVIMEDLDGDNWRRKGSLSINNGWNTGLVSQILSDQTVKDLKSNTDFSHTQQIDPAAGLCTLVAFQTQPYSHPIEEGLVHKFEKAIYSQLKTSA